MAKFFKVNDFIESNAKGMVKVYEVEGAMELIYRGKSNSDMFAALTCGAYDVYEHTEGCTVITSIDFLKFNSMTDYHETDEDAKLRIISSSNNKCFHELFEDFMSDYYEGAVVKVYEGKRTIGFENEVEEILKRSINGDLISLEKSPVIASVTVKKNKVSLVIEQFETEVLRYSMRKAYGCYNAPKEVKVLFARPRFKSAEHALKMYDNIVENIYNGIRLQNICGTVDISLDMCSYNTSVDLPWSPEYHFVIVSNNERNKIEKIVEDVCIAVIGKGTDNHYFLDYTDYENSINSMAKYYWCLKRIDGNPANILDKEYITWDEIPSLTLSKTQKKTGEYYELDSQIKLGTYEDDYVA